jgi:hypothetical protein
MLLLSILYRLVRCLLDLTAVLLRRDVGKDAELLVFAARERRVVPTGGSGALLLRS